VPAVPVVARERHLGAVVRVTTGVGSSALPQHDQTAREPLLQCWIDIAFMQAWRISSRKMSRTLRSRVMRSSLSCSDSGVAEVRRDHGEAD